MISKVLLKAKKRQNNCLFFVKKCQLKEYNVLKEYYCVKIFFHWGDKNENIR